jgi:hypothetical protein
VAHVSDEDLALRVVYPVEDAVVTRPDSVVVVADP